VRYFSDLEELWIFDSMNIARQDCCFGLSVCSVDGQSWVKLEHCRNSSQKLVANRFVFLFSFIFKITRSSKGENLALPH
jgi:hypothetical protein